MEIEAQFRESYFSNIKRVRNPVSVIRVTFISQKKKKKKGGKTAIGTKLETKNAHCTRIKLIKNILCFRTQRINPILYFYNIVRYFLNSLSPAFVNLFFFFFFNKTRKRSEKGTYLIAKTRVKYLPHLRRTKLY